MTLPTLTVVAGLLAAQMPSGHPRIDQDRMTQTGPVTTDPSQLRLWLSFRVGAIEGEKIYLSVGYHVVNLGATFDPGKHGVVLPVPAGAVNVKLPPRTRGATANPKGVTVYRKVAAGRRGLSLSVTMQLPYEASRRRVRLSSSLPMMGYAISIRQYRGVAIRGKGLGKPTKSNHAGEASPILVYRNQVQEGEVLELTFDIYGLRVRSRAWSRAAAGLGLAFVLLGFALALIGWGRRRRTKKAVEADDPVEPLVDDLVSLARDKALGLVGADEARERKAKILAQAAAR